MLISRKHMFSANSASYVNLGRRHRLRPKTKERRFTTAEPKTTAICKSPLLEAPALASEGYAAARPIHCV